MKAFKIILAFGFLFAGGLFSCQNGLEEMNQDPNGVNPGNAHPNLVLSTVLSETGRLMVNYGFQDIAGVIQHTQKDGWGGGHNQYEWNQSNSWSGIYDILKNNQFVYDRSVELGYEMQQGVALVMKCYLFGLITDFWGDAPYSQALKGAGDLTPVFDSQEAIYTGILADLEKANTLLSKAKSAYISNIDTPDVYFKGDHTKWRAFANSLALRYYMRLSVKKPEVAKAGIEKIVANASNYPIITSAANEVTMTFPGIGTGDSWPSNTALNSDGSNYRRLKMCSTLVEVMRTLKDPRLSVWANKVQIPLVVDSTLAPKTDKIENGKRYLSPDVLVSKNIKLSDINQNVDYVGLPPALTGPQVYNMSPDANQASKNPHVSWINDIYKEKSGDLLRARLLPASEVLFILAEAAQRGWAAGDAKTRYEAAIRASFDTWKLTSSATEYLAVPGVPYDSTLKQLITQKWISGWSTSTEAWFDYRRTGYPELKVGTQSPRKVLPVRFYYNLDSRNLNAANATSAIQKLEVTSNSEAEGNNSAWSKMWVLQGTGKPW